MKICTLYQAKYTTTRYHASAKMADACAQVMAVALSLEMLEDLCVWGTWSRSKYHFEQICFRHHDPALCIPGAAVPDTQGPSVTMFRN